MKESNVIVWHGGRGSGKTMSMSVEGYYALLNGDTVWANYPIAFGFRWPQQGVRFYRAQPIAIEDLITFKPEICRGKILLDELNLWASNRGHASMVNRLLNSWLQLIRKRELSLEITTQNFMSLDLMIRWQCDISILCSDNHFRYRHTPPGASIGQLITDESGIMTSQPLFRHDDIEYDEVRFFCSSFFQPF